MVVYLLCGHRLHLMLECGKTVANFPSLATRKALQPRRSPVYFPIMATKHGRFDMDWWIVQKRLIYIIIGALILTALAVGAWVYVSKYGNPFSSPKTPDRRAGRSAHRLV